MKYHRKQWQHERKNKEITSKKSNGLRMKIMKYHRKRSIEGGMKWSEIKKTSKQSAWPVILWNNGIDIKASSAKKAAKASTKSKSRKRRSYQHQSKRNKAYSENKMSHPTPTPTLASDLGGSVKWRRSQSCWGGGGGGNSGMAGRKKRKASKMKKAKKNNGGIMKAKASKSGIEEESVMAK